MHFSKSVYTEKTKDLRIWKKSCKMYERGELPDISDVSENYVLSYKEKYLKYLPSTLDGYIRVWLLNDTVLFKRLGVLRAISEPSLYISTVGGKTADTSYSERDQAR